MKTSILLLLSALGAALTSTASATWVDSRTVNIQQWTPYIIAGTDQVEEVFSFTLPQDGYVEVQDVRCTGDRSRIVVDGAQLPVVADLPYECENQETHPELAKCHGKYWRRTINIRAGQHEIKFPTIRSSLNRGVGYFRIQLGEPNPGPSTYQWPVFVSKLWISSYNTDRYENTNLLYSVHPNELSSGAVGKDFESQQLYPLCERNTPQPPPPAPSCPVAMALSADLAILCKLLNLEPFVVRSGQWDAWAKATALVAAHGQQDAWVYGYDTPSNLPLTIQTVGAVVPAGTLGQLVPAVDNSARKFFLCKSASE
ncbi:hypothetical protein BCR44DRAFT_1439259 [Catenaria anguillulae PL171]|uniref:Uncharacterized protein n=1 Tax=Catenaria anguillulae PL171 TaxID=765915 RepID=A0A1Y2HIT7_9FUNG|nr:hypothetical protein BCR44DRAFT_1439259 [Catenaria anguillulae PL171]